MEKPVESENSRPRLLFVHSGSPKKRLTFEAASALGAEIYLLNPETNWAADYAHELIPTAGLRPQQILNSTLDLHRRVHLDGVVTFWEEDVPTTARLAERLALPGNDAAAATNARSKYRMRCALRRAGVPVPLFARVDSEESLRRAVKRMGLPAILKPEWGSDSEWVTRVTTEEQALAAFRECRQRVRNQDCIWHYPTGSFVLEGYLAGPEVSVEGVVQQGRITLYAIIDKDPMAEPSFIERGECTPSRHPASLQNEILEMVRRGVEALSLTNSAIHAEIKLTRKGPRIVEIGARMGGDCIHALVKRVYGIDLAEQSLRVALGLPVAAPRPAVGFGLSRTLVPDEAGLFHCEEVGTWMRGSLNLIEIVLTKRPGDPVRVPPDGYDNLAWVSVWGKDYRTARRSLNLRARRVADAIQVAPAVAEVEPVAVAAGGG